MGRNENQLVFRDLLVLLGQEFLDVAVAGGTGLSKSNLLGEEIEVVCPKETRIPEDLFKGDLMALTATHPFQTTGHFPFVFRASLSILEL